MESYKILGWFLLSGVLMGTGFVLPDLWWFAIGGVAMQVYFLYQSSFVVSCVGIVFAWWVKYLFALSFFWSAYPINWLPIDLSGAAPLLIVMYWASSALFLAFGALLVPFLMYCFRAYTKKTSVFVVIIIPLFFVLAEILSSIIFSLFTIGGGGSINASFSFGYLGYLIAQHKIIALISIFGGVYVLTLFITLAGVGVWFAFKAEKYQKWVLLMLFVTIASTSLQLPSQSYTQSVTVAVIETTTPVTELFNRASETSQHRTVVEEAVNAAMIINPGYILLPEDARYFSQSNNFDLESRWLSFKHPSSTTIVIDSGRVEIEGKGVLQGLILDTHSGRYVTAHKRYLVPQGEYMPALHSTVLRLVQSETLVSTVASLVDYTVGPQTSQAHFSKTDPGILFCFESIVPTGIRSLRAERLTIPFIVHPVSHSWFNEPASLWSQLEASLRVQAIWNQLTVVSAGNHAPSFAVTRFGEVLHPDWVAAGQYWRVGLVTIPILND